MAAVGTVLCVAQTLFSALDSPLLKEICSTLGYKSELKNLQSTVSTVRAVLLDAESRQDGELSHAARDWIEKLKYAVYDADDLLDEFTTLAHQKKLLEGGTISREVRSFFSRYNQLGVAYTMSRGIKKIRKQLDAIARDHTQFGLGLPDSESIRKRNKETCSYVFEQNIIGRDDDKKVVIRMLLDPHVEGNVSFVTIVGIGGLGKTALAQLVYNDEVIKNEFPLRMWVCVSDQDPKYLDIKAVLCKILESATERKHEGLELDWVQHKVRNEIEGKRYLLVFDDVWIEDRDQCLKLGEFLMGGARGSRIVVTTRSKETARVIGKGNTHELKGLSEENSWCLFKRLAFDEGQADLNPDLVDIGKNIVKKCANVPLAIRMVATLLYGKNKMEWQAIERKGLGKVGQDGGNITHVLKLSYYHLETHLKSCFSFCAIFPKDYVMEKAKLITLWIAQGYVEPLDEDQNIYYQGEEYFSILLRRCFFQDVKIDKYGEIESCKMHDLMHDIAQEVAGDDVCEVYAATSKINEKARHVFHVKNDGGQSSLPRSKIRTCLRGNRWDSPSPIDDMVTNWKYLRALDLKWLDMKELPCAIGKLLHLRYLDLSCNGSLERLPKEIIKLQNMQTLLLRDCYGLKELPSDLSKLAKLRVLDIQGCTTLRYMACGMDKLRCLCILPLFIVAEVTSTKQKQGIGRLEDIAALNDLKGKLSIEIHSNVKGNYEGGFLKRKEHINKIKLFWLQDEKDENKVVSDKALMEELQPNPNLKGLWVSGYGDVEKPSWAIDGKLQASLPNLVSLRIEKCKGLEDLPMLGRLQFLKKLRAEKLENLEYMEKGSRSSYGGNEAINGTGLFPSLEELWLWDLPKLKGWWRGDVHMDDDEMSHMPISFPRLSKLNMWGCPLLTSMPLCPTVEDLNLYYFNERLEIMKEIKSGRNGVEDGDVDTTQPKLRVVRIDDVGFLKSLPMPAAFQSLSRMWIVEDEKVENLSEVEDVFWSCSASLQKLEINKCMKVRSISGALEHLTALKELTLLINSDMINDEMIRYRLEEEDGDEVAWSALQNCLHYLAINYMPRGIRHLTSLHTLTLEDINHVKAIPEWITCLSSLQKLEILNSSQELRHRCKSPDGADWPKIQHIPKIHV